MLLALNGEGVKIRFVCWYNAAMDTICVTFLGSGDAFGAGGRNQAAYLVQAAGTTFLLDCGTTTLAAMNQAGISPDSIDTILLSHLHGDHFAGLPFLFLQYTYLEPRRRPLCIAGPPGTEDRVRALHSTMYGHPSSNPLPLPVAFVEVLPGQAWVNGPIKAHPFEVPHQKDEICLGFAVEIDKSRILYSGDSGWTEDLVAQSAGTDLFICECSFYETRLWSHLDYPRIFENHHRFSTRRLILTHLGREVLARKDEVELELAFDGLRLTI